MPPTAVERFDRDKGWFPQVSDDTNGLQGTRFFMVDTDDPVDWINASGLPARGDPFPGVPLLLVQSRRPTVIGGRLNATSKAWSIVEVGYGTEAANADSQAEDGAKYSEFSTSTQQVQVITAANGSPIPPAQREVNTAEVKVTAYRSSLNALAAFIGIQNKINSNAVDLPALQGLIGSGLTAAPGQLLARSVSVTAVRSNLVKVVYTFGYGPVDAFKVSYRYQDADGNSVAPTYFADVQGTVAYPAAGVLW